MGALRSGEELLLKWMGLDYERTWDTFTYHFLLMEGIGRAIEMGLRRVRTGPTAFGVKKLIGSAQKERFLAFAIPNRWLHRFMGLGLRFSGKRAMPSPTSSFTQELKTT